MGKASKFGLRKAAEEKTKKHAQRTPLPPRAGEVDDARDAIEMAKAIQATGKAFAKKVKKVAKLERAEAAGWLATMAVETSDESRAPGSKAAAFMADAVALGWVCDVRLTGSEVLTDVIQASRGDETIQIEWQNEVFQPGALYQRQDGTRQRMQNAAAARRQMASPPPTEAQMAARRAVRERTGGETARTPVRQIGFRMEEMTDDELAETLRGAKLVWVNSISTTEDSDTIPPHGRVYVDEQFSGRTVHFNSPVGARSVRLSSIIHITGDRSAKVIRSRAKAS